MFGATNNDARNLTLNVARNHDGLSFHRVDSFDTELPSEAITVNRVLLTDRHTKWHVASSPPGEGYRMIRTFSFCVLLIAGSCFGTAAIAQSSAEYPNGPIRIIIQYSAGGGVDFLARVIADGLHKRWGQPVVCTEN